MVVAIQCPRLLDDSHEIDNDQVRPASLRKDLAKSFARIADDYDV